MTETTADNRPEPPSPGHADAAPTDTAPLDPGPMGTEPNDSATFDGERPDPLDRIAAELDELAELDPAEAVPVLADITAELNRELDADTERS